MRGRNSILVFRSQAGKGCGGVQGVLDTGMGGYREQLLAVVVLVNRGSASACAFGLVGR